MIYVRIHFVCTYLDMFILCIYTQMIITTYMHFLASRQESHHYSTLYSIIHLVVFIPKSFLTEISSPEIPLCFFSMTSSMFDSMVFQNFQLGTHIRHFYLFQFLFFFLQVIKLSQQMEMAKFKSFWKESETAEAR